MTNSSRKETILPASYRWAVFARVLLASLGSFALVSASGAFCASSLAHLGLVSLPQAVHVFTLLGFVLWCALAMWVFAHGSLLKLTLTIALSTTLFAGLYLLVR